MARKHANYCVHSRSDHQKGKVDLGSQISEPSLLHDLAEPRLEGSIEANRVDGYSSQHASQQEWCSSGQTKQTKRSRTPQHESKTLTGSHHKGVWGSGQTRETSKENLSTAARKRNRNQSNAAVENLSVGLLRLRSST